MTQILSPTLFPSRAEFDELHKSNPVKAADLLTAMRHAARRNLGCFVAFRYFMSGKSIRWNWHLDYLCDIFTAVHLRQLKRTIVNIPPRHLKSELIGQCFPAWMIGRENNHRSSVLSASATATLAIRDSRKTLEIIESTWYKTLFPHVVLSKSTDAEWETSGGANRNAAGVGGTITGKGASVLVWDDLLLPGDAMSELVREKTNEWLGETFRSRLDDPADGSIVGIMQRLHELDPTGYLLNQGKNPLADQYHHIVLPLIAPNRTVVEFKGKVYKTREEGDVLHPDRFSQATIDAIRVAQRNNFEGQYQQNPIKMEGGHLDPRRLVKLPYPAIELKSRLGLRPCFYMDFAATEKQTHKDDPDYNVILVGAKDQMKRLIVLDVYRVQTADQAKLARTLINMRKLWLPTWVKCEKGSILNTFQQVLFQQQQMTGDFFPLTGLPGRRQDKVERSMGFQGMLNAGMICVPENAPWLPALESELRSFPRGAHDDMCDTLSDLANDYQVLPTGDAPYTDPADERVKLNQGYIKAINQAISDQKNPKLDNDGW